MTNPVENLDEILPSVESAAVDLRPQSTQTTREGETSGSSCLSSGSPFPLENIRKYGLVASDAAAAGLAVAATQLSSSLPVKVTSTLSGSLWTSAALVREWDNSARSKVVSSLNFLGGATGVLVAAAPHLAGENRVGVRYAIAGGWAANSLTRVVHAVGTSDATIANRILNSASGLVNAAGAALSAAAVNAAAESRSVDAVKLATASGAMLLAGWVADTAAVWNDQNRSKLSDGEQRELPHSQAQSGRVVADGPENDAHSDHSPSPLPDGRAEGVTPAHRLERGEATLDMDPKSYAHSRDDKSADQIHPELLARGSTYKIYSLFAEGTIAPFNEQSLHSPRPGPFLPRESVDASAESSASQSRTSREAGNGQERPPSQGDDRGRASRDSTARSQLASRERERDGRS
ncbi:MULTISPECIES: hypothetical protein [Rhizobium]|uniref:hypothetical protein n=1 Tax=Rhizobium TaxID=379 RepID=UPI001C8314AA|nr:MULTISPECIES: hypothetical protein [Rhizobium]MBX4899639.1 hypothetical protein [Rhizobium bangladeshense]MBX5297557.1 hypothetical protein [Rhizobium sp. NLR15a]MBY3617817.1 hypothetical protein [Rhizobium bangladeshense]